MSAYDLADNLAIELLDGRVPADVQALVDLARDRVELAREPTVPDGVAPWLVDIKAAARKNGRLTYVRREMSRCPLCRSIATFAKYKSGPRRGEPNYGRKIYLRGVDLDCGFVTTKGHVSVGACDKCMAEHADLLRSFLASERVELPTQLATPGQPRYVRHDNRTCEECGWQGHEGEMRKLRTLLGDGWYAGGCPNCPAQNLPLSQPRIIHADGFTLVEFGVWQEATA